MTNTCKKCMFFCAVLTCAVLIVGCQGKKTGPSAVAQKDGAVVEELDVIEVVPANDPDKASKNDKKADEAKPESTDQKPAETPAAAPAANEAMPTDNAPAADSESQSAYIWEEDSAVESESTFGHRRWNSSYYNCCTVNSCCVPAFNPACAPACSPCETCSPACGPACVPACGPCAPACGPCVPKWGCGRRAWRSCYNPCVTYCNPCAPVCVSGCDSSGCEGINCDGGSMNSEAAPADAPAPVSSEKSSDKADQNGKVQQLPAPTMSDYRPAGSSQAIGSEVAVPEDAPAPTPAPTPAPAPAPEPKSETK